VKFSSPHSKVVLWILAGLLALLYLTDFGRDVLTTNLDKSWIAVIAWAAHNRLQWGQDILFTNGPVGYLLYPLNLPVMFWPALFIRFGINLLLLAMLFVISMGLHPVRRIALILTTLFFTLYNAQTTYVFMVVVASWLIFVRQPQNRILQIACISFLAIATMMKGTFLSLVLTVMVLGLVYLVWRRDWLSLALTVSGFVITFVIAWTVTGQEFSNILPYLQSTFETMRGFSPSMSFPPQTGILVAGLIGLVAAAMQIAIGLAGHRREQRAWFMSLILIATLFLVWKMSFTRADGHTIQLFLYGVPAVLALPVFFLSRPKGAWRLMDYVAIVLMTGCGWFVIHDQSRLTPALVCRTSWTRLQTSVAGFMAPGKALAKFKAAYERNAQKLALPEIKKTVGQATVDVFGHEQAVALANDLNYTPRPVWQGYVSATAPLIKANADFYRSARAPQFVIFKLQTIEAHIPTGDDSGALLVLTQDYQPVLAENGYLLLQRKPNAPAATELTPISSGEIALGDSIPVPEGTIWCRLHFRENFLGKLRSFFYQSPQLYVAIQASNGQVVPQRVITGPADYGFLINPLLRTETDFRDFVNGNNQTAQIKSVRAMPPKNSKWLMRRWVGYELFEVR